MITDNEMITELNKLGTLMHTQDNLGTSDPIFMVQNETEWFTDHDDDGEYPTCGHGWWDKENCGMADDDEAAECEKYFAEHDDEPEGFKRIFMHRRWDNLTPFFTMDGAKQFMRNQAHHYDKMRVYVDSGHNNPEWKLLRRFLMSFVTPPSTDAQP